LTWFKFRRLKLHGLARRTSGDFDDNRGEHTTLTILGLTFRSARYHQDYPQRRAGDSYGIHQSFWITSPLPRPKIFGRERGFSFGWGVAQDWAQLQYLEFRIGGRVYASEKGKIDFQPPIEPSGPTIEIIV